MAKKKSKNNSVSLIRRGVALVASIGGFASVITLKK